jgi:hypothetical protein
MGGSKVHREVVQTGTLRAREDITRSHEPSSCRLNSQASEWALSSSLHLSGRSTPTGSHHVPDQAGRERLAGSAERRREPRSVITDEGHRDHHLRRLRQAMARQPAGERPAIGRAHPRWLSGSLDRLILPTFGHHMIHTISRDDVDKWYERPAKNTPTYRARLLTAENDSRFGNR